MSDRKFTVEDGDEIVIRVPSGKKPHPVANLPTARKAMMRARRPDEFLPRRLKRGSINFYDLGQILVNGEFVDLPFSVSNVISAVSVYQPETNSYFLSFNHTDAAAQYPLMFDLIANVPLSEWRTKYKKIEYAEAFNYGIYYYFDIPGFDENKINASLDEWTEAGLKLNSGDDFLLTSLGAFLSVGLKNAYPDYKVTANFNFAADHVNLNLSKATDVFLIPMLGGGHGWTRPPNKSEQLFTGFHPISREMFLNRGWLNNKEPSYPSETEFYEIIEHFKSRPDSRRWLINTPDGSGGETAVEAFPFYISEVFLSMAGAIYPFTPIGTLQAVIMQGDAVFYCWKNAADAGAVDYASIFNYQAGFF